MPADINTYGLTIEFNLQDGATPQLRSINDTLIAVEEQINNIAAKALGGLQNVTEQIAGSFEKIAKLQSQINDLTSVRVKPLKDSSAIHLQEQKILADESIILKDKLLDFWIKITKVLEMKGEALEEEYHILEKEETKAKQIKEQIGLWSAATQRAKQDLTKYWSTLTDIYGTIKEAVQQTDQFTEANFRLYGSQTQLVQRAAELGLEHSILRTKVIESYKELANLRIPIEMIDELAVATAEFSAVTGVGIPQTAAWHKLMVSMGDSAQDVTRQTAYLANTMRNFGLDTKDVTSLMQMQQSQAGHLLRTLGSGLTKELQGAQVNLKGFYTELGVFPDHITAMNAALGAMDLSTYNKMSSGAQVLGLDFVTTGGQTEYLTTLIGDAAAKIRPAEMALQALQKRLIETKAAGKDYSQIQQELNVAGIQLAFTVRQEGIQLKARTNAQIGDQLASMAAQRARQAGFKSTADDLKSLDEALKRNATRAKSLDELYKEALATLSKQFGLLTDQVKNTFIIHIMPILERFLVVLTKVVEYITVALNWVKESLDALGPAGEVINRIILGLILAIPVYLVIIKILHAFGIGLATQAAAGNAAGKATSSWLEGLAKGLEKLRGNIPTMLALGALMIAAAIAAVGLAYAVTIMAKEGWFGIAVLAGLTIAIVGLAIGLAFAGKIAEKAVVGLLVLSVALVAVAFSAYLLAMAMVMIAEYGWFGVAVLIAIVVAIALFAAIMVALGYAAMGALPGIIIVIVVLVIMAVVALALAYAIKIIIDAIAKLGPVLLAVAEIGKVVVEGIKVLGAIISVVAGKIVEGLYAVAGVIRAVGDVIAKVIDSLGKGALQVAKAFSIILEAAKGLSLFEAGSLAVLGAAIVAFSGALLAAAPGLWAGGKAFISNATATLDGAIKLQKAAGILSTVAPPIVSAADSLQGVGNIFRAAADGLRRGLTAIISAFRKSTGDIMKAIGPAENLRFVAALVSNSANLFFSAGTRFLSAATSFYSGGSMLHTALSRIVALNLKDLADSLEDFSIRLNNSADALIEGTGVFELINQFGELMLAFSSGVSIAATSLYEVLDDVGMRLADYAEMISEEAKVIAAAFQQAISPTIAGVPIVTRAETINTMRSGSAESFGQRAFQAELTKVQRDALKKLINIDEKLFLIGAGAGGAGGGGEKNLAEILDLLKKHLPMLVRGRGLSLASAASDWMR